LKEYATVEYIFGLDAPKEEEENPKEDIFELPFACPWPPFRFWVDFVLIAILGGIIGLLALGNK
jgi:hypothetical protein